MSTKSQNSADTVTEILPNSGKQFRGFDSFPPGFRNQARVRKAAQVGVPSTLASRVYRIPEDQTMALVSLQKIVANLLT